MNSDPVEHSLRKLRPPEPPAEVTSRAREIWKTAPAGAPGPSGEVLLAQLRLWRAVSAGLGVCAATLLALLVVSRQPGLADERGPARPVSQPPRPAEPSAPRAAPARLVPVDVERTVLRADDEGIFMNQDAQPVRRVRLEFLETERLLDVAGAAWIHRSVPREAVLGLPVRTD